MAGELRLFDSDAAPVTPRHLAASGAMPLMFEPVEINGRLYWDGEMTRDSLLPALLRRLPAGDRLQRGEALRLVVVSSCRAGSPPCRAAASRSPTAPST